MKGLHPGSSFVYLKSDPTLDARSQRGGRRLYSAKPVLSPQRATRQQIDLAQGPKQIKNLKQRPLHQQLNSRYIQEGHRTFQPTQYTSIKARPFRQVKVTKVSDRNFNISGKSSNLTIRLKDVAARKVQQQGAKVAQKYPTALKSQTFMTQKQANEYAQMQREHYPLSIDMTQTFRYKNSLQPVHDSGSLSSLQIMPFVDTQGAYRGGL